MPALSVSLELNFLSNSVESTIASGDSGVVDLPPHIHGGIIWLMLILSRLHSAAFRLTVHPLFISHHKSLSIGDITEVPVPVRLKFANVIVQNTAVRFSGSVRWTVT